MAASVYISKNLTKTQVTFLKLLNEYEIQLFRFDEIETQIEQQFDNLNEVLENLVHKGFLSRIERGKFCRPNFTDENVIGTFVVANSAVAYWSALNQHGLTEQFSNTVFIQTSQEKEDKIIFGTSYKFVKIIPAKRIGIMWNGQGNFKYPITDIEKTIIDCFDQPQYSGGYAELLRAFVQADLKADKMTAYCKAAANIAVTKRIGFLAEFFEKKSLSAFIDYAETQVNGKYNLVDPLGNETGDFVPAWRLRLNISREQIEDIAQKQY
jgi:predicted transcriptional regulator of viral defense system